jgi:hypothetical protein
MAGPAPHEDVNHRGVAARPRLCCRLSLAAKVVRQAESPQPKRSDPQQGASRDSTTLASVRFPIREHGLTPRP